MKQQTAARSATADNVRAEMARKRVTQGEIAALLGIGQPAVSGKLKSRSPFDIDELAMIAERLDVSITTLVANAQPFRSGVNPTVDTHEYTPPKCVTAGTTRDDWALAS